MRVNYARLSLMAFKSGYISRLSHRLLTEWVYVEQTEVCLHCICLFSFIFRKVRSDCAKNGFEITDGAQRAGRAIFQL